MVINQTPAPLYCSDACRLADFQSCYINDHSTPSHLSPIQSNASLDRNCLQDGVKGSRSASYTSLLSPPSVAPTTTTTATVKMSPPNSSANAYLHLSAMYGFDPLPPPPPFTPKTKALAAKPPLLLEGGVILAARCIKAALCIKTTRSFWGDPIPNDPSEDNKPIPG